MHRISGLVVSVSLLAFALMGATRAEAAVDVQLLDGLLVLGGSSPDRNKFVIEHFADAGRNGLRVRQLGLRDPTISSNDPDCATNPVFNDVVCAPLATSILINSGSADDTVLIGGSNVGCQATAGTEVTVNLQNGNDVLRAGLP